jgi:hypothetical protein
MLTRWPLAHGCGIMGVLCQQERYAANTKRRAQRHNHRKRRQCQAEMLFEPSDSLPVWVGMNAHMHTWAKVKHKGQATPLHLPTWQPCCQNMAGTARALATDTARETDRLHQYPSHCCGSVQHRPVKQIEGITSRSTSLKQSILQYVWMGVQCKVGPASTCLL